jgi:hypothetical protein
MSFLTWLRLAWAVSRARGYRKLRRRLRTLNKESKELLQQWRKSRYYEQTRIEAERQKINDKINLLLQITISYPSRFSRGKRPRRRPQSVIPNPKNERWGHVPG